MNGDSNNLIVNSYSELIDIINKTSVYLKRNKIKEYNDKF